MTRRLVFACGLGGLIAAAVAVSVKVANDTRAGRDRSPTPAARPDVAPPTAGLREDRDADAVFQRAFWRRRAAADRVLHAERRAWVDDRQNVERWQWFIALEPGADFRRWLLEENPFELVVVAPDAAASPLAGAPAWFPAADARAHLKQLRTRGGGFTVFLDEKNHRLFATDAGGGFAAVAGR